jgi:Cu-Zn family superoxide dismutase
LRKAHRGDISKLRHIAPIVAAAWIFGAGCRIPFIRIPYLPVAPAGVAQLKDANGRAVGNAVLVQENGSVRVIIDVTGLPPGHKGVHVHAVGQCDPPSFESSGDHFNPTNAQHGSANPQGPHLGDLPNIAVDSGGRGHLEATLKRVSLETGGRSVFDADGSAIVIHADPDDLRTDPSGNSGARIACGPIRRGN